MTKTADFSWPDSFPEPMAPFPDGAPHRLTPDDVIGAQFADLAKRHFAEAKKRRTPEEWEKAMAVHFSENDRRLIADLYAILHDHGWWPNHFDGVGRLCFAAATSPKRDDDGFITERDLQALESYFSPGFARMVRRKLDNSGLIPKNAA